MNIHEKAGLICLKSVLCILFYLLENSVNQVFTFSSGALVIGPHARHAWWALCSVKTLRCTSTESMQNSIRANLPIYLQWMWLTVMWIWMRPHLTAPLMIALCFSPCEPFKLVYIIFELAFFIFFFLLAGVELPFNCSISEMPNL